MLSYQNQIATEDSTSSINVKVGPHSDIGKFLDSNTAKQALDGVSIKPRTEASAQPGMWKQEEKK